MAIDIEFDLPLSEPREAERKLWKHVRWERLKEMVANKREARPEPDDDKDLNGYAQYILDLTTVAVKKHKTSPSYNNWKEHGGEHDDNQAGD
jgi:hypothetical protein